MNVEPLDPPRTFTVGLGQQVELSDCGRVDLAPDELVTLRTDAGGEYDIVRKSWGFYATPSLNHRLPSFGLHGVLVRNRLGHRFVLLVERGQEAGFEAYRASEGLRIETWLDGPPSGDAPAEAPEQEAGHA